MDQHEHSKKRDPALLLYLTQAAVPVTVPPF
jgi:hypothetical protein